jgi:hypothetical protein
MFHNERSRADREKEGKAFGPLWNYCADFLFADGTVRSQIISGDLGVGQFAILQNINFWAFGILVFIFALGFGTYFARSRAVTVALSIFAWMIFLAGLFPTAPLIQVMCTMQFPKLHFFL